jgi:hypothetical protein
MLQHIIKQQCVYPEACNSIYLSLPLSTSLFFYRHTIHSPSLLNLLDLVYILLFLYGMEPPEIHYTSFHYVCIHQTMNQKFLHIIPSDMTTVNRRRQNEPFFSGLVFRARYDLRVLVRNEAIKTGFCR